MTSTMHEWSAQDFVAGRLCLEFTNTIGDHTKTRNVEWLTNCDALLKWALAVGAFEAAEAQELRKFAQCDAAAARRSLQRLLNFRSLLFRVLSPLAAGRAAAEEDLEGLEVSVFAALRAAQLRQRNHTFAWTVPPTGTPMKTLSARIALSALRLLQMDDLARLRECQRCSWLFLDRSKNHGRRWCRAEACGNRARVARHYRSRT
jgi:predicted RNA-binding Zn ribbon-like protein